jgi:ADP-heptose:LPS heptosyltransferase
MLYLSTAAGAPAIPDTTLYVPSDAACWWRDRRGSLPDGPFAVLAVTSRWVSKAWPAAHWAQLAERLVQARRVKWVMLPGSAQEQDAVAVVADAMQARGIEAIACAGQTDVGQLMATIDAAAFTVSNDSAALHMALGLGARCLGLYGPTDPAIVGPWGRPDLAIRAPLQAGERPAYRDRRIGDSIMQRLEVDAVFQRIAELAETWSR